MTMNCLRQRPRVTGRYTLGLCFGVLAVLTVNSKSIMTKGKVTGKIAEDKPEVRAEQDFRQSVKAHFSNGCLDWHQAIERFVLSHLLPEPSAGAKCGTATVRSNIIRLSDEHHSIPEDDKETHSDLHQQNSSAIAEHYRTPRDVTSESDAWSAWIGLKGQKPERQWMWDSGNNAAFFNWKDEEPNNKDGIEDCVNVWPSQNTTWNDYNCNATFPGVCQKEKPCGSGWKLQGQSCYRLTSGGTWEATRLACHSWKGVLAEIHNFEQQRELQDFLRSQGTSVWSAWIGLKDQKPERQWMWDSGINATFFNWLDEEPNNKDGIEDCVNVWPSQNTTWNDYACNATFPGVCQKGCTDSSTVCRLLSPRGLCTNALFKSYVDYACRRSCLRC